MIPFAAERRERLDSAHLVAFDRALEWARMGRTGQNRVAAVGRQAPDLAPQLR